MLELCFASKTVWSTRPPIVSLSDAIAALLDFGAKALVVSLGVDTIRGDPECVPGCGMCLDKKDFGEMGKLLRAVGVPTIFVQEGGYNLRQEGKTSECWADEAVGQVLSCGMNIG